MMNLTILMIMKHNKNNLHINICCIYIIIKIMLSIDSNTHRCAHRLKEIMLMKHENDNNIFDIFNDIIDKGGNDETGLKLAFENYHNRINDIYSEIKKNLQSIEDESNISNPLEDVIKKMVIEFHVAFTKSVKEQSENIYKQSASLYDIPV